jgi:hypothetical protein
LSKNIASAQPCAAWRRESRRRLARTLSLPLWAWTVRSEEDKRKAEALGVNYVFDHLRP